MSLVKIGDDLWTGAAIKSTFKILIPDKAQSNIEGGPTIICGLGWRFSCSASTQSSNQATVFVGSDGETLPTWRISVFFDPHLIRSAAYGSLSFSIAVQHLFIPKDATPCPVFTLPYQNNYCGQSNTQIGTYIYTPGLKMVPTIAISVIIPAQTGLSIPRSIDGKLERLLADTMSGKPAVDVKFYAFTRKNSRYVTHPQPIFARSELLEGFSDELDLMISGGGFGEAKLVDLDRHRIDKERVEDYDYMSDSDLDSDDEAIEDNVYVEPIPSDTSDTSFVTREASDVPLPPSRTASPSGRMGRAVTLNGTAFKTWQALLYYLYTSKLPFSAPQPVTEVSEPPLAVPVSKGKTGLLVKGKKKATAKDASAPLPKGRSSTPQRPAQCSTKSMYRLADKLGLDDLRAVSLSSIKANLTTKNIIREVFSDFTSRYSEVQDIEVEFVLNNFPVLKDEINKILDEICQGYRPHCLDVLRKIVAGRNSSC
ncbi:hypothetical protein DFH08DRAFT_254629 [Mycena albidolilacea]|uniref:Uncharacterized protein n=1 Tax=Mycena albidolilacea TaxID=1033008 RepID=A0AAD7EM84_9AGAR|nr:hypothetical protein DFH08DRAFT_254629 [Mycena albidolilacea]